VFFVIHSFALSFCSCLVFHISMEVVLVTLKFNFLTIC